MNWILASGSPRRRELLEMLGVPDLTIRPAKGPERATPGAGPEQTVRELSLHKAQEAAQTCAPEDIIIAADTIVYLDGAILGKPRDHDDAVRMLTALSGREHIVYTGVAVLRGGASAEQKLSLAAGALFLPVLLLLAASAASSLLAYVQQYVIASVGEELTLSLRQDISRQLGRLPLVGDHFQAEGLDVTVTMVDHRRVLEVRVAVAAEAPETAEGAAQH